MTLSYTVPYDTNIQNILKHYNADYKSSLFFDIETTGLSAKNSRIYAIGTVSLGETTANINIYFNDDGTSELSILNSFTEELSGYSTLISFNGDTFDIPFIKNVASNYGISNPFSNVTSLDMYRIIRPYKDLFNIVNLKQSSIERFLGLKRDEFISGGELINVYKEYLKTKDESMYHSLITHNKDDLAGMLDVIKILYYDMLFNGEHKVNDYSLNENSLRILLNTEFELAKPLKLIYPFNDKEANINSLIAFSLRNKIATIEIPVLSANLCYYFENYKDYYYLPAEDRAIHKSLGMFVDASARVKATKKNCYIRQDGTFVPAFNISDEVFKSEYNSKYEYMQYSKLQSALEQNDDFTKELASSYIALFSANIKELKVGK